MKELKEIIVALVVDNQGIKGTNLLVDAISKYYQGTPRDASCHPEIGKVIPDLIEALVDEKRIIRVCYCLPQMPDRLKSFYLPQGSKFIDISQHSIEHYQENADAKTTA